MPYMIWGLFALEIDCASVQVNAEQEAARASQLQELETLRQQARAGTSGYELVDKLKAAFDQGMAQV